MYNGKNFEVRDICSVGSISKKLGRCRSFHFRYLELCRAKNLTPLPDIRGKNNATSLLEFLGDKLSVNDWLLIVEALYNDQVLQTLSIRLRKCWGPVLEHLDTEKKAKLFKQKPSIYTKFVCTGIVEAVSNCIEFNKNLRVLHLEGLPLNEKYVESLAKALSSNEGIKDISFQRSNIGDKGCEAICNTIKYLDNVEKLNLSDCQLTTKGAECIADMIKIQKISRYTEGWQKSLRYRDVDPDSISGLRSIALARNPKIGDEGVQAIVEILKDDVWVKVIDMESCGLTDRAANYILDCLEMNNYITDFNVRGNVGISKFLQRSIREQLGKDDDDGKVADQQHQEGHGIHGTNGIVSHKGKVTVQLLKEQLKTLEEQLAFERVLRKKAEQLNEKLNQQIIACENQLEAEANAGIPLGYVVVKNDSLQSIIRERNDFQMLAKSQTGNANVEKINYNKNTAISLHNRMKQYNQKQQKQVQQQPQLEPQLEPQAQLQIQPQPQPQQPQQPPPQPQPEEQQKEEPQIVRDKNKRNVFKEPRKSLKVRKVKSEMKYVEPSPLNSSKKESKSDHEFSNESDFLLNALHFETNIGDSIANNSTSTQVTARIHNKKMSKLEFDELSMPTSRSANSNAGSSDSDTLRNEGDDDMQAMKVFVRRPKLPIYSEECGQGEGIHVNPDSPRTLFMGLCDD